MPVTDAATLAGSARSFVAAPAGCGKTHLIAEAVCSHGSRRDLVLTHTHAGVDALRRKMQEHSDGPKGHTIDTLARWALRYASAFPVTSGLQNALPRTKSDWDSVYDAASRLLVRRPVRDILTASYSGAYVDEYQDCTVQQHRLVLAIASIIPTRVLGDPLQGIFDFGRNEPVDWDHDVRAEFSELPQLTRPWRWEGKNEQLGQWLASVRENLMGRTPLQLEGAPVRWESLFSANSVARRTGVCLEIARQGTGTVVAIHAMPPQCHFVASRLKGLYQCVEPIESEDLSDSGLRIQTSHGPARAAEVIDFASKCMTRVSTVLGRASACYKAGAIPRTRSSHLSAVHSALRRVVDDDSLYPVCEALESFRSIPQSVVFRRELLREMLRGVRLAETGGKPLGEALWEVRNRTRFAGRRLVRCVVGSTLLVKGLEFDHAVILDADNLDVKNLYVALTRGTRSLTIFSRTQTIMPRWQESDTT